ncbi:MAG TPA: hypothetical protein VHM24_01295, partial [Gemmatimonadaceae bacterium]|nr:hypothetical protein [Gemmatimonadaceae bacterium]
MSLRTVAALAALFVALTGVSTRASAQHEGHTMPGMKDTTKKKSAARPKPKASKPPVKKKTAAAPKARSHLSQDTAKMGTGPQAHAGDSSTVKNKSEPIPMSHAPGVSMPGMTPPGSENPTRVHSGHDMMSGPLSLTMERMGSGTTWIPDAVTLPSRHRMFAGWEVMTHGFVFGQYDHQGGPRGDDQIGSLNWIMLMASRELGGGHFQARTMLSLDPATVTSKGYPLLLQTGEAFDGKPLHDRQHPHDFFMELAVLYQREFNHRIAWSLYAAPSGEPALGPVAFMHRPSAMDNPAAPLGHHWQDATHVSFGVVTAGVFTRRWQFEASVFNGREPDEHRWNFDSIKLDSYSGRVTANPG